MGKQVKNDISNVRLLLLALFMIAVIAVLLLPN